MRSDVRMGDTSMTYTEAGNYDFMTDGMGVGMIRARALLGVCCFQRENQLAVT